MFKKIFIIIMLLSIIGFVIIRTDTKSQKINEASNTANESSLTDYIEGAETTSLNKAERAFKKADVPVYEPPKSKIIAREEPVKSATKLDADDPTETYETTYIAMTLSGDTEYMNEIIRWYESELKKLGWEAKTNYAEDTGPGTKKIASVSATKTGKLGFMVVNVILEKEPLTDNFQLIQNISMPQS